MKIIAGFRRYHHKLLAFFFFLPPRHTFLPIEIYSTWCITMRELSQAYSVSANDTYNQHMYYICITNTVIYSFSFLSYTYG